MKSAIPTLLAGSIAWALFAPVTPAQVDPARPETPPMPERRAAHEMPMLTESHAMVRGSTLIGAEVQNTSGDEVGEIKDLVLGKDGSVAAVLIACDDKPDGPVAVPLDVFEMRLETVEADENGQLPNDREIDRLVLGAAHAALLEDGPRARHGQLFDKAFVQRVRTHFGKPVGDMTTGDMPSATDESGMDADTSHREFCLASKVLDKDVVNTTSEDLGEIEDLAVAVDRNEVAYAVMESGGILGIGEKRFAVPLHALDTNASGSEKLVLDISRERLAQADGFERWPTSADTQLFPRTRSTMHDGTSRIEDDERTDRSSTETARRGR